MPSKSDLARLPKPKTLAKAMRCCAVLDVVLCEDDDLRSYDFQPKWCEDVQMAKYDNGGGDYMFIFVQGKDAIIKGFDHESPVSPYANDQQQVWPGIYDGVPAHLDDLISDVAVSREDVTFCVWHSKGKWQTGKAKFKRKEDGGAAYLLGQILQDADDYCEWAEDYYELELDVELVESVFAGATIDEKLILELNPDRKKIKRALKEIAAMEV